MNAVVTVAAKGIRKGSKRCVAVPKRKPKGAKNCTRQVNAARGSATLTKAGAGTLALPKKGLGKGRYTAVLTARRHRRQPVQGDGDIYDPMT